MGIFSGLFKSRDKPTNATSGSAYRFFLGGTTSGKSVNERSAMQMTAVYSCVRILSEAIAGLPVHLYQYNEDGGKGEGCRAPLVRAAARRAEPGDDVLRIPGDAHDAPASVGKRLRADHPQRQGRGRGALPAHAEPHDGRPRRQGTALLQLPDGEATTRRP